MVRLATRKTPSKNARYASHSRTALRSKLSTRKKNITKKRTTSKTTTAAPTFLAAIRKLLTPMQTELTRFEMQLKKQVKTAKSNKVKLKTELALQKRFHTLHSNIIKFKTKWFGRFNSLNRHASKNIQLSINQIKKEVEELRKSAKRNLTILNRYTKSSALKKGFKMQPILNAAQTKGFEMKFNTLHSKVEKFRMKADQYLKQLRASKKKKVAK